ncbi:hypothetical protein Cgig2_025791 [Carnegiea gigantea]|uniref:Uncharacterized protein n=1 Tax=Carnegiea gigantea TaxID=171969 RepID=A0A9Q1GTL3_9CARY|nr:hypothetical protein Cgig2_025791 [Carnegiea gigantea]
MAGDNINESEHASSCFEPNTTPSSGTPQLSPAEPSHSRPPLHPNSFAENEFIDLEPDDTGTQSRKPRQLKSIVWNHFRRVMVMENQCLWGITHIHVVLVAELTLGLERPNNVVRAQARYLRFSETYAKMGSSTAKKLPFSGGFFDEKWPFSHRNPAESPTDMFRRNRVRRPAFPTEYPSPSDTSLWKVYSAGYIPNGPTMAHQRSLRGPTDPSAGSPGSLWRQIAGFSDGSPENPSDAPFELSDGIDVGISADISDGSAVRWNTPPEKA